VDEYQDTSVAQFHLVRLLAGGFNNVCGVDRGASFICPIQGGRDYFAITFMLL